MNYEKKYKDLVEKLKKAASDTEWEDERFCCVINEHFSELQESEDEKIIKAILSGLKHLETELGWDTVGDIDILDAYAWLEKRGEHAKFREYK